MGVDVEAEGVIQRPRTEVAAYATEPANDPQWISGVKSAQMVTDPPVRVGTRVERRAAFLGKRIDYLMEIAEFVPAERIVMRSVRSPFPMRVTYRFDDAAGGTRVGIRVEGDASGFYRLAAPLLARSVKAGITRDLANLRSQLEGAVR
jgi:uncharacterized membrane protein